MFMQFGESQQQNLDIILKSLLQNSDITEKEKSLILEYQELISKNVELTEYITLLSNNLQKEISIRDLIDKIRESLDLDETLAIVINEIAGLTKTDRCIIYLVDKKDAKAHLYKEFRIRENIKSAPDDLELTFLFNDHYKSRVTDYNSVLIENIDFDSLNDAQKQYFDFYNIKSLIITPITYKEELLGLILMHQNDLLCDWDNSHSESLRKISNQAAISIKHAILYARLMQETKLNSKNIKNMPVEFKNHITSVIGFSELLLQQQQNKLTDKQKQYLNNILESAHLLNKSINDILGIR